MTDRAPQTQDKFVVRLPEGMRDRIAEAATRNSRSMNAEIVARLQSSFGEGLNAITEPEDFLKRLEAIMAKHGYVRGGSEDFADD